MALNIKELEAHALLLREKINALRKLEEELAAIELLIEREKSRQPPTIPISQKYAKTSIEFAVKDLFKTENPQWVNARKIAQLLAERGATQAPHSLRANVGSVLRRLIDEGFLERRKTSGLGRPVFVYATRAARG